MNTERLEARIDRERRHKLAALTENEHRSVSDIIRKIIDQEYDLRMIEVRMRILREMAVLNLEDVPEPDELSNQLNGVYDLDDLY